MTNTALALAYILTSEADADTLGDPELVFTKLPDEDGTAEIIGRMSLSAGDSLRDVLDRLNPVGEPTKLERGHYVVEVAKV